MIDSNYFIDTNILVHITLEDFDNTKNIESKEAINNIINNEGNIYLSTQVLREFYAIVTNKKYFKKPLTPYKANDQIKFFISQFNIINVDEIVITNLLNLTSKYKIIGQNVHDTTIVASMLTHKIKTIITYNKKDFDQFKEINPLTPFELLSSIE